jgi:hypothetical protein
VHVYPIAQIYILIFLFYYIFLLHMHFNHNSIKRLAYLTLFKCVSFQIFRFGDLTLWMPILMMMLTKPNLSRSSKIRNLRMFINSSVDQIAITFYLNSQEELYI